MSTSIRTLFAVWLLLFISNVIGVTVYDQTPLAHMSSTATTGTAAASYTGAAAYDTTVLNPPDVPTNLSTQFGVQLQTGGSPPGASIKQSGAFMGFSIEMSVANQVLGKNSSFLQVPFLNLMSNLVQRAGSVHIRVGGNTQETAVLVDHLDNGKVLEKDLSQSSNPTNTPPLIFSPELLYMMSNVSDLVNVYWYLGVPFNDSSNFRLAIAEKGKAILGSKLLGMQAGNEPDLYTRHGHRQQGYSAYDYMGELEVLISAMTNDPLIGAPNNFLVGPSIATGDWTPEDVWNTGFIGNVGSSLAALSVEHYPSDNCVAQFHTGGQAKDPQTEFPNYLNHDAGNNIVSPYLNSTAYAQIVGKPFLMFETNTASCGGFPGISDAFGTALWALDYGLTMAYSNFSGSFFHIGGQNVYYNPFTPAPTNQSTFHQWTVGPIYYSALVMAEVLGPSNETQVLDLGANNGNTYTPAYAIYERGEPVRAVLFNFVTDASGASDLSVSISVGNTTPSSVKVKYLRAASVSQKGNYTWAGQTFGGNFGSDGRLQGNEDVRTVNCGDGACSISVPAPAVAVVFLTQDAQSEADEAPARTFSTTAHTKMHNTATVDMAVLATSNGHTGMENAHGSTSRGSSNGARRAVSTGASFCFLTTVFTSMSVVAVALV
ncbi:hypothetical protein FISHEDRAFT_73638 [Fistulina hepatica ATCC 64428]|uniref:Beta-glucuronidase C-terminal domain-containing protein n=1 Tax=Fistulina hepatica ATCC 64428 TaxID=1128425 RepID=A0A0D7ABS3_9AGAR|nr:hypothetical protein FISHEDRAFT_73638 [Fistulina hepatica ATCC 64428]